MPAEELKESVSVEPHAFVVMAVYAAQHAADEVHGLLVGKRVANNVIVSSAIPVCHETPTKPLVETALELVQSHIEDDKSLKIVGWFTASEMLSDDKPGPVALRIVANMEIDAEKPVLLVLRNKGIGQLVCGEENAVPSVVHAYGKDFGQQWMDPLELSVRQVAEATRAAKSLFEEGKFARDLIDHWAEGNSSEWPETLVTNKYF